MGINNIPIFKEGDYVVVTGATTTNDGMSARNMSIAHVVGVGKEELFLKCSKLHRIYKRPIANCFKIPVKTNPADSLSIASPKLGDFVLSYSGNRFTKDKKVIGILIEIIDSPPADIECRILCGEETHVVSLNSVIVVEGVNSAG
jgi:hypothetical protein